MKKTSLRYQKLFKISLQILSELIGLVGRRKLKKKKALDDCTFLVLVVVAVAAAQYCTEHNFQN